MSEKMDRLMELYMRYSNRVKAETERLNDLELDDLEMDEEEKYNQKLVSGLYTLQEYHDIVGDLEGPEDKDRAQSKIQKFISAF